MPESSVAASASPRFASLSQRTLTLMPAMTPFALDAPASRGR